MEFSTVLSSNSNRSVEEFDVVNDCENNVMLIDDTDDVSEEEEDFEKMSLNTCDQSEENDHFNDSEHLDINNAAGLALVELKEERNPVKELPVSFHSLASSELFSPSELSRIEGCNARFEANNATLEYLEFLKEEEVKGLGSDVVLTQDYPTSDASSELVLTPLQAFRIKTINDAYRVLNEEKEIKAMEALLLAEMSITQCTGYGASNGNFVVNRVIEGLLPKIHSNQLTRNWLLNEKNSFETIPF